MTIVSTTPFVAVLCLAGALAGAVLVRVLKRRRKTLPPALPIRRPRFLSKPRIWFSRSRLILTNWDRRFQSDPVFLRKLRWSNLRGEITSYSRVLQLLTEVYVKQVVEAGATQPWKDDSTNREHPPLVVTPPSSAILERAWDLFAAGMRAWSRAVQAEGRAFMVTSIPMHHVMRKEAWERYTASFGARGADLVPDHVDSMISNLARDAGFLYFPVIGPMREQGFANDLDFYYHAYSGINWGHLNAVGHRFLGKELARQICGYWQILGESGRTQ